MIAGDATTARHAKQRDWYLGLDGLAWIVRGLILVRALQLTPSRARPRAFGRGAPKRNLHLRRAATGSRLRAALRHKDMARRVELFVYVLTHIDEFAAPLAKRLKRRLMRLMPVLTTPQPAPILYALAAPAPCAADSS